jgi:formate dehydrogenase iron-sulfur subunit
MSLLDALLYPFARPAAPGPRRAAGFFTDTTLCIGCKACEVACKQWNQLPSDGFTFTGASYDNTVALNATTWRHVAFVEDFPDSKEQQPGRWLMMSDVCKHCSAAPCQMACPTGALIVNEFQNVYIQNDICNGCGYCVAACPFGVITRSALDGHAHKCTLCYDRQRDDLTPACAKACPTGSIQFAPLDELRERARARARELTARGVRGVRLYGDAPTANYSPLGAFFLLLDEPSRYGLPDDPLIPQRNLGGDWLRTALGTIAWVAILLIALAFNAR